MSGSVSQGCLLKGVKSRKVSDVKQLTNNDALGVR